MVLTKAAILLVLLLLAAAPRAYAIQPAQHQFSGSAMFTPQSGASMSPLSGNVTYHGGPVMHSPTNFAIFWLPSGYHFDTPALDVPYVNASDANYESLIDRFLRDVSDTSLYSILQQYTDAAGAPGLSTTFGGSWVDTAPYPNSEGTRSNPLQDSDIQGAVTGAMAANHWPAGNGTNEFFVFTADDIYSCGGQECSYNGYCSYHSAFGAADGETVIYAYVPDPGNANADSCLATTVTGLPSPNGAAFADSAVNLMAHEEFESVTDSQFNGWFNGDIQQEIADECVWQFGSVSSDGSNIVLGGNRYLIQETWSNANRGCFIPLGGPVFPVTAVYKVNDGGSGFTPPAFTYWYEGTQRSVLLSTTPTTFDIDGSSPWNVTRTLEGSTSSERWHLYSNAGGTVTGPGTVDLDYQHQYLLSLRVEDSSGAHSLSPSSMQIETSMPNATVALQANGTWIDAGASFALTQIIWEGVQVAPTGITSSVLGPEDFTVFARVYDVGLRVSDVFGLSVPGASVHITLVNGTNITRTTGKNGTVSLSSIPLGSYQASVSSLGLSQRVSANTPENGGLTRVTTPASLPVIGTLVVILLVLLASAYYVVRRRRMYWL